MIVFVTGFVFSFLSYLILTAGSGNLMLWSGGEITAGLLFSLLTALLARGLFSAAGVRPGLSLFNPKRWVLFLLYVFGPFLTGMIRANLDVAYRVITGKIKPGIVRIPSGLKTDFGLSMLANSITLTPGTLSVDEDDRNNLYVHCIYVRNRKPKARDICSGFPGWIRRITE
ncbi:MAG: Na+/H+ antiporter subunit E [Candidatus Aenigmarchaeota archaeon]|nr:Na+/H+ antiporter subunit E [Candidatus Aenigmarchaeota archaeon]